MKQITLSQVFSPKQLGEISKVLANAGDDQIKQASDMKKYLAQHEEMLNAQGIVPNYMAYVIVYVNATDRSPKPSDLINFFGDMVNSAAEMTGKKPRRKKGRKKK